MRNTHVSMFTRMTDVDVSLNNNAGFSTLCPEDMMGKVAGLKDKTTTYVYYLKPELFIIILKLSRRCSALPEVKLMLEKSVWKQIYLFNLLWTKREQNFPILLHIL